MGLTMVPTTALGVMAATATAADDNSATKKDEVATAIQGAIKDIILADDAAGTDKAKRLTIADADTGLKDVQTAIRKIEGAESATVSLDASPAYSLSKNQITATLTVADYADGEGKYNITIDAKVAAEALKTELQKLDLTYNNSITEGENERNVKQAAQDALSAYDGGLTVVSANYSDGGGGDAPTYAIVVSGTFEAGDFKDITLTNELITVDATSADASLLEKAAAALNDYKKDPTDAATTEEEVSDAVQSALDAAENEDTNFDDVTFTIENFKKTDDKITADVFLKQGNATKTVKLNKAIDKTGLSATALSGITAENLGNAKISAAAYNFTKDTDGVATGLDSDALAAAVKKAAEKALKDEGYTNAVANVTITTYAANDDKTKGDVGAGYAAGTITVTRNGETSSAKIFTINCEVKAGSYSYTTTALGEGVDSTGVVRDDAILQKSDNQKIASAVETLDKKIKKDATLGVKNGDNKNVPLTKKEVLSKATDKINETLGDEDVTLKLKTSDDGKTVTPDETDADAIVVKSYTAPTTEAEGTAVITVNYNHLIDGKTAGSTTASDYVAASHDITLTFPKLSARKTSAIDVKDSTSKIELTMNATDTTDAKDYFKFNGNSALTWSSSDESVFTVDEDGNLSPVGIGEATLTVAVADNDSVKATKTVKVTGTTAFKDVQNPKAWYYNAIYNLANKKNAKKDAIVQGIAKDEFGVSAPITRAQFVTFLYRLADEPAVTATTQFTDVDASAYYAKAVAWAVQKGITDGKTDTTFDPNATVSRAEAVTFLYRYKGEPDYNSNIVTAFTDLNSSAYYYDAVQWATGTVTNGKTSTTFAPNDPCTRAEGITMIYRANPVTVD